MKVDAFIPTVYKDLNKLTYVIDNLILYCQDIADIHVSMPDSSAMKDFEKNGHKIVFHNDFDILNVPLQLCRFRPNWIYQQLLKLCQRVTSTEYYYVIDSDIIPTQELNLFSNGKPVLFSLMKTDDGSAFIRFIAKATGGDLAVWSEQSYATTYFIADCMLFKKQWVDEMVFKYFSNYNDFCLFTLMNTFYHGPRTDSIYISEYELYGRYIAKYHCNEVISFNAERNNISRDHISQLYQAFSNEFIEDEIEKAKIAKHQFLKLQSGCCASNITYVMTKTQNIKKEKQIELIEYLKPFDIDGLTKIRLGNNYDGGYIAPYQLLSTLTNCITYGVANDVSFEVDLQRYAPQCKFSFYDPTVIALPHNSPVNSVFHRKWVSSECDVNKITPHQTIVNEALSDMHTLLKCDIEGAEYGSIQTLTYDDISHIAVLIIEIHWIYNSNIYSKCKELLEFIAQSFTCFHTHANIYGGVYEHNAFNESQPIPKVFELTYVNNALVNAKTPYKGLLPIAGLDFSNDPSKHDYDLSFLTNGNHTE